MRHPRRRSTLAVNATLGLTSAPRPPRHRLRERSHPALQRLLRERRALLRLRQGCGEPVQCTAQRVTKLIPLGNGARHTLVVVARFLLCLELLAEQLYLAFGARR